MGYILLAILFIGIAAFILSAMFSSVPMWGLNIIVMFITLLIISGQKIYQIDSGPDKGERSPEMTSGRREWH